MHREAEYTQQVVEVEQNYIPIKPLSNRIVIFPETAPEITKSGIIIPDTAKEPTLRGVVVAIGEKAKTGVGGNATELKMGDLVLYGKYAGSEIEIPGDPDKYLIMREDDVFVILAHKGQKDCSEEVLEDEDLNRV